MEELRSNRLKRFGEMHSQVRVAAGKSQEFMSMELGVSKKTVQNWEKGISSPSYFQSLEWFRVLNVNPFTHLLAYVYPDTLRELKSSDSEAKINEAFNDLVSTLPLKTKRAFLFLFYGKHGSSPNAVIELLLAHLHTPLTSRITQATLIAHTYEMEKELGNLICNDNIQPDTDKLNKAIMKARVSALHHEYGYNNLEDAE